LHRFFALRAVALAAAAAACCTALTLSSPARAATKPPVRTAAQQMLDGLNAIRRAHGLRPFKLSAELSRAAIAHAESMATKGYFSHDSADGSSFDRRLAHYYAKANQCRLGENIIWASGGAGSGMLIRAWMASHGHRENILTPAFREIGIGIVEQSSAQGVYGGQDVEIAVTDFGGRTI
jgi:uncharacterized protein YkwD